MPAAPAAEIYLVNASAYFARPGPRIIDSIEILAGILHPKEFPEFAFRNTQDKRVAQHNLAASYFRGTDRQDCGVQQGDRTAFLEGGKLALPRFSVVGCLAGRV